MPEVICLGELLIDFVSSKKGVALIDAPGFVKAPGGAPANVAAGVARLGREAGFIGKIGDDAFGHYLRRVLADSGVDVSGLALARDVRTTLAFVAVTAEGVPDFSFYRHPGADMMLGARDIKASYIRSAKIFHFGSISLIDEGPKAATLKALDLARRAGALVTYDPNLRPSLWRSAAQARREIWNGFAYADVTKVSDEEWEFVTGIDSLEKGSKRILDRGVKLVIVSRGKEGAYWNNGRESGNLPGYKVKVAETTGAGDAFVAQIIVSILREGEAGASLESLGAEKLNEIIDRANASAAICCTKIGAIPGLPTSSQVARFLAKASGGT